ncbi:MAG: YicC family protein [Gammaproteobacteria bacterium]|nr:YicC family protein [Gammaproteobacteria bacterium]
MTHSMTAFARQESSTESYVLAWEMRSVNHRYLEINIRVPDSLRSIENSIRGAIRSNFTRGKIECHLRYQITENSSSSIKIDTELVSHLLSATEQIKILSEETSPLGMSEILKWPGVIIDNDSDSLALESDAISLFKKTMEDLKTSRAREGKELGSFIQARSHSVLEIIAKTRELMPQILTRERNQLLEKISKLKIDVDSSRLEAEIVLLTQKADIEEELDRLHTHITEVQRVLTLKESKGRRLDFLMQELNREANTLSSKSIVIETTRSAVDLKVLIEQMREQIQNVE